MVDLIPSWSEVAGSYPYAPGRAGMSNAEWKQAREEAKQRRAQMRQAQAAALEGQRKREKAMREYEKDWAEAEQDILGQDKMVQSRDELPGRNREILREGKPTWGGLARYVEAAYEKPQNPVEGVISYMGHLGGDVGDAFANMFGWKDEEDKDTKLKPWLEQYIASGGGSGAGLTRPDAAAQAGLPFPDIKPVAGYSLEDLDKLEAPKYQEHEFDKWDAIAEGLANADWINMDMSKAVRAMNKWSEDKSKNKADTANATTEAEADLAKWKTAQKIAQQEANANLAFRNAQLAIAKWEAQQPRALGGNRMFWRDSNGNLHFQQIDKQGEARTVGNNAAMIEMMDLDPKKLKGMTPKKILQRANQAAMLYPDKDKIPFIQGYIMQATQMLPMEE